ncbi:MAG: HAD family phosphatase [Hespellia sp.]|nr:HAD family phosphatase [Hespellia sp.]
MRIQGILFDMDGVLLDTERLSTIAWQKTAKRWQIDLPVSFINSYKGKNLVESRKLYLQRFGTDFPYDEFRAEKTEYMQEDIRVNGLPVKKGVYDLLKYAKEHQIKLAVATSTSRSTAEAYLRQVGIYEDFQAIVYGDSVAASKPEPDIYLEAAKQIGVKPEECFVIEDSTAGVMAGYHAGAQVIHIPDQITVPEEVLQKTYRIVEDMTKVIDLLEDEILL